MCIANTVPCATDWEAHVQVRAGSFGPLALIHTSCEPYYALAERYSKLLTGERCGALRGRASEDRRDPGAVPMHACGQPLRTLHFSCAGACVCGERGGSPNDNMLRDLLIPTLSSSASNIGHRGGLGSCDRLSTIAIGPHPADSETHFRVREAPYTCQVQQGLRIQSFLPHQRVAAPADSLSSL